MTYLDKLDEATTYLKEQCEIQPSTLIILGSGLGDFTKDLKIYKTVFYRDIPYFTTSNVSGHQAALVIADIEGTPVFIMKGRNHYYQGLTEEEMRLPIQLFANIGVLNMIVTNACGGMNPSFKAGDIMIIEDHINMMGRNPLIGDNVEKLGPRFIDMSAPYDLDFISLIESISIKNHIKLQKGVYVGYLGPNYETRSEIKAFRMLGGDAVGMSTVPEVIVARHSGLRVLGLSVITNMSTGIQKSELSHDEVLIFSKQASSKISILLRDFIKSLNNT